MVCQRLVVNPYAKSMVQKKQKVGEEKRVTIDEEVGKLFNDAFITKIKYPIWLANVVLVRKATDKWHMCVDSADLNMAYLKDIYPLANIDLLIDGSLGHRMLSFMNAYLGYNYIKMDP